MKVWGCCRRPGLPADAGLARVGSESGWKHLCDGGHGTVRFTAPGLELDPGGIGKEFAVDPAIRDAARGWSARGVISAGVEHNLCAGRAAGRSGLEGASA